MRRVVGNALKLPRDLQNCGMIYTAKYRFVRMSPKKIRRVLQLVQGMGVEEALDTLKFTLQVAAQPISMLIRSAASNAIASEGSAKMKAADLYIKSICVDSGPTAKRIRPMAMGRAYRIRKRTSHLKVVLITKPQTAGSAKGSKAA